MEQPPICNKYVKEGCEQFTHCCDNGVCRYPAKTDSLIKLLEQCAVPFKLGDSENGSIPFEILAREFSIRQQAAAKALELLQRRETPSSLNELLRELEAAYEWMCLEDMGKYFMIAWEKYLKAMGGAVGENATGLASGIDTSPASEMGTPSANTCEISVVEALKFLILLKDEKVKYGETEFYKTNKEVAWENARKALVSTEPVSGEPVKEVPESLHIQKTCKETDQPVGLPSDAEIEQLAVSRIATWLWQKCNPELPRTTGNLDLIQAQARELWGLIKYYPKGDAGSDAARTVLSTENNALTMPVGSNPRTSRAPTEQSCNINELTCAKASKSTFVAPAVDWDVSQAWGRVRDAMEYYASVSLYSLKSSGVPGGIAKYNEVGYLATNCAGDVKAVDKFVRSMKRESGWQPIETAPKDREILGFGSYLYPGDKDRTTYHMLIEWDRDSWCSYEGNHADGFFTHWQELTKPTSIEGQS